MVTLAANSTMLNNMVLKIRVACLSLVTSANALMFLSKAMTDQSVPNIQLMGIIGILKYVLVDSFTPTVGQLTSQTSALLALPKTPYAIVHCSLSPDSVSCKENRPCLALARR